MRQWANAELIKAANLKNISTAQEMKLHLVNIDNKAFQISREEMNQLAVLFEDDNIKVVTWLDMTKKLAYHIVIWLILKISILF